MLYAASYPERQEDSGRWTDNDRVLLEQESPATSLDDLLSAFRLNGVDKMA